MITGLNQTSGHDQHLESI